MKIKSIPSEEQLMERFLEVVPEKDEASNKETFKIQKNGKILEYSYECIQCAECCRANFEIFVYEEDIKKWIELEKHELIDSIRLRPESIAIPDMHGIHVKIGKAIKKLKIDYGEDKYYKQLEELKKFIKETHDYFGEDKKRPKVYSMFKSMRMTPILIPKELRTVLDGLERGLQYAILNDSHGTCHFLQLNHCGIHKYKPLACRCFPHNEDGNLRINDYRLKKCQGFKLIRKLKG